MQANTTLLPDHRQAAGSPTREGALFGGSLVCRQPHRGYRFSVDAVLLGHFPAVRAGEAVLDLGTGCGIVGLILLFRHGYRNISVTGMEHQTELLELAAQNCIDNGYQDRFRLIRGQVEVVNRFLPAESFSLVVANPPFYRSGSGRLCGAEQATAARHQSGSGLQGFVDAAAYCLKNRGRTAFIYPASQAVELIGALTRRRLEPKRLQFIYSYPGTQATAKLVLIESVKNGGAGAHVLPPCYIYRTRNGAYSAEVQAMYQP
jgi:tRNA1Val (adenine37-N6)-methyltransferase